MEEILFERNANIATVTISNSEALNALSQKLLIGLEKTIETIRNDKSIYCVILTGAGSKSFVAGASVNEMKDLNLKQAKKYGKLGASIFRNIELLDRPVIAAINGYALGGGLELALSCDIRIATENSVFAFPEVSLGIIPGFGGIQKLVRLVGPGWAKEITLTGFKIDAYKALQIGLVNMVVSSKELIQQATSLAEKIAANAPIAIGLAKKAINFGMENSSENCLSYELELFSQCFTTEDQKDAMAAFIEKKKLNVFKNR